MGNKRMSTKPYTAVPAKEVRNYIASILHEGKMRKLCGIDEGREIGFQEVWVWEERPVFSDLHYTRVTFHGRTYLSHGWAEYEGMYGKWIVDLIVERSDTEGYKAPCTKVYGTPDCVQPSDEWRETPEQKRERLTKLFEQYPMNEGPNERWSWYKVERQ